MCDESGGFSRPRVFSRPLQDRLQAGRQQAGRLFETHPAPFVVFGAPEFGRNGQDDRCLRRSCQVVTRDLARPIRRSFAVRLAPAKCEIVDRGFLRRLPDRGIQRRLVWLDHAFGKIPVAVRPQDQHALAPALFANDDNSGCQRRRRNTCWRSGSDHKTMMGRAAQRGERPETASQLAARVCAIMKSPVFRWKPPI